MLWRVRVQVWVPGERCDFLKLGPLVNGRARHRRGIGVRRARKRLDVGKQMKEDEADPARVMLQGSKRYRRLNKQKTQKPWCGLLATLYLPSYHSPREKLVTLTKP